MGSKKQNIYFFKNIFFKFIQRVLKSFKSIKSIK